jgi:hypothetical protein
MTGRSKRRHGDSPIVDVADVFADDALIDALVAERGDADSTPAAAADSTFGADPLIELFDIWRDEISSTPLPPAPLIRHTSHAVAVGRHRTQRTARPAMFIAVAICALLVGSAAVGSRTARPGDTLWALASVLWTDRTDSIHSLGEVKIALAEVQDALDAGRPQDAREALMRATVQLGHVDDLDMPASMPDELNKLWVDVIPEAEYRQAPTPMSPPAAAIERATAQPDGSTPATAAGIPTTPLLGTILEALIASAQPSVSTDSSTTQSDGPSVQAGVIGFPPVAGSSAPGATTAASTGVTTDAPSDSTTAAPTQLAPSVTPTPPPATTEPAPQTSAAVVADPTTAPITSQSQTSTENSAPAPPPPSTEPSTASSMSNAVGATPAGSTDGGSPAVAGSDPAANPGSAGTP